MTKLKLSKKINDSGPVYLQKVDTNLASLSAIYFMTAIIAQFLIY